MMRLADARGECQRCSARWRGQNAQALDGKHERSTGHPIEVVLTYRSGSPKFKRKDRDAELPLAKPTGG